MLGGGGLFRARVAVAECCLAGSLSKSVRQVLVVAGC